jgi:hypothetical protein
MLGILTLVFPFIWAMGWHWLVGYAVWFGWLWRSQKLRPLAPAMCVWIASILVNGWWLLPHFAPDDWSSRWWWLFATSASAVALIIEIWTKRNQCSVGNREPL